MLEAGDTVVLRSGGPTMTVDQIADNYGILSAWCSWFDGKKLSNGTFPVSSLKAA